MTSKRLGCVVVKSDDGRVEGIFTDGDLRRLVERRQDVYNLKAGEVIIRNPKRIAQSALIDTALALMEKHSITQLPTVDEHDRLTGIIHLHDILRSKLV
jgi:arabinose-5-phosphate isomerase